MLNHPGKAGPTAAAKDRMPRPEWKNKSEDEMIWFQGVSTTQTQLCVECSKLPNFSVRDHSLLMVVGGLARMRGGSRRTQDSQRGGGGHQEICTQRGGATCFFILFYFPIAPLGLTGINGLQASKKGQQFMATNDMSQYYVQNEIGVVTVQLVPCLPRIVLVPEELPVLQCTTTRSSWQSLPSTELLDSLSDIFFTSCSCLEVFAWFLNLFVGFVGFYRSPCLLVRV